MTGGEKFDVSHPNVSVLLQVPQELAQSLMKRRRAENERKQEAEARSTRPPKLSGEAIHFSMREAAPAIYGTLEDRIVPGAAWAEHGIEMIEKLDMNATPTPQVVSVEDGAEGAGRQRPRLVRGAGRGGGHLRRAHRARGLMVFPENTRVRERRQDASAASREASRPWPAVLGPLPQLRGALLLRRRLAVGDASRVRLPGGAVLPPLPLSGERAPVLPCLPACRGRQRGLPAAGPPLKSPACTAHSARVMSVLPFYSYALACSPSGCAPRKHWVRHLKQKC